jgi:hypothetical protein
MSSKRRQRRITDKNRARACTRKKAYLTEAAAWEQVRFARQDRGAHGLSVYRCAFADHFHIGHALN